MTSESEVLYEVADHVATVTLNRPESLNAFNGDVIRQVIARLEEASEDKEVRVVVLTGAGKGFCAGGDVKSMAAGGVKRTPEEARLELRTTVRVSELLHDMPKPTIAAVNGACAGAGLSIACAADLRYAKESAAFTPAFARVGASGDYGGIWLASKFLGSAKARQLFLLGDKVPAPQAKEFGLVADVFPDADFIPKVMEIAARIATFAPLTIAGIKENLNLAETTSFSSYLDEEVSTFIRVRGTNDAREAVRAFVEKRPPVFHGE